MIDLNGTVAIVTGAASPRGIGAACARRLALQGAAVMLTDIDPRVEARAEALRAQGLNASSRRHDVGEADDWRAVVDDTAGRFGRVDILVNNAGIVIPGAVAEVTLEDWRRQMRVNLDGTFLGCAAVVAEMRRANRGGAIVNISSMAGVVAAPGASAYGAGKGGVRALTKALAIECAGENIRVNSVHPGLIESEIHDATRMHSPEAHRQLLAGVPLGRMGEPDDVASLVAFLASPAAGYITGAEVMIDGGFTAR